MCATAGHSRHRLSDRGRRAARVLRQDKGLDYIARSAACHGGDRIHKVVTANRAVLAVSIKQESLCEANVGSAVRLQPTGLTRGADGRQWLPRGRPGGLPPYALRIHVVAQDHQKRRGPAEFHCTGVDPGEGLPAQWPLAIEDRLALDRPIDDLARRAPSVAAVAEQVSLAGSAVGRVRPVYALAVGAGDQEEPLTRRRVAEIGRIEDAPFNLEPGALQCRCPGAEIFAAPAFDRSSGAQIERAPIDEFRYVLDEQLFDP